MDLFLEDNAGGVGSCLLYLFIALGSPEKPLCSEKPCGDADGKRMSLLVIEGDEVGAGAEIEEQTVQDDIEKRYLLL